MAITSSQKSSSNNKTPPTINVSLSTPAQEKLDSLLKQESEFLFITPINSPTFPATANDNNGPKFPSPIHVSTITAQHEDIPPYEHTAIDMPPSYQTSLKSTPNRKSAPQSLTLNSGEAEEPWPITKKLFFIGFFFWPLWFVGMGFSMFGKSASTRTWGKRCAWNSLVVAIIFAYLVIAYIRTGGRLVD